MRTYEDMYKSSGLVQLKQGILEYCGVSLIQNNFIGPLYEFDESDRKRWIRKVKDFALEDSAQNVHF